MNIFVGHGGQFVLIGPKQIDEQIAEVGMKLRSPVPLNFS